MRASAQGYYLVFRRDVRPSIARVRQTRMPPIGAIRGEWSAYAAAADTAFAVGGGGRFAFARTRRTALPAETGHPPRNSDAGAPSSVRP